MFPPVLLKSDSPSERSPFVAILWLAGDSFLSGNQFTARAWDQLKLEVKHDVAVHFGSSSQSSQAQQPVPAPSSVPNSSPEAPSSPADPKEKTVLSSAAYAAHLGAKPYITAGLTPMEVISVLGNPTSSTGEKMFYKRVGDRFQKRTGGGMEDRSRHSDPGQTLVRYALRSRPGHLRRRLEKSDVIAMQGTPTLFSDNEFGYGNSHVFFQNDRVTGWKEIGIHRRCGWLARVPAFPRPILPQKSAATMH